MIRGVAQPSVVERPPAVGARELCGIESRRGCDPGAAGSVVDTGAHERSIMPCAKTCVYKLAATRSHTLLSSIANR